MSKHNPDLLDSLSDMADLLEEFVAYSDELRKIGRGFGGTDRYGCPPETTIKRARALLATLEDI